MEQPDVDDIIHRLLEVRGKPTKQFQLTESEIKQLCVVSREIFLQQPNLLELQAPIKICGINSYVLIVFHVFLSNLDYLFTFPINMPCEEDPFRKHKIGESCGL